MHAEIVTVANPEALAREAAQRFSELAQDAVASRGRFSAVLSGGSTPGALYRMLAGEPYREGIPWGDVHLFWGDERLVPPDDPGSNYLLAEELLISHVPIPPENIYRIRGELEGKAAARSYANTLQDFFCGPYPRFDLVLLGLGSDGHTASLFPGSPALGEKQRLAAAVSAVYGDRPAWRVTLTLPALNSARHVLFLVQGSDKTGIVRAVLDDRRADLPAQLVLPTAGQVTWLLDEAASGTG